MKVKIITGLVMVVLVVVAFGGGYLVGRQPSQDLFFPDLHFKSSNISAKMNLTAPNPRTKQAVLLMTRGYMTTLSYTLKQDTNFQRKAIPLMIKTLWGLTIALKVLEESTSQSIPAPPSSSPPII